MQKYLLVRLSLLQLSHIAR